MYDTADVQCTLYSVHYTMYQTGVMNLSVCVPISATIDYYY